MVEKRIKDAGHSAGSGYHEIRIKDVIHYLRSGVGMCVMSPVNVTRGQSFNAVFVFTPALRVEVEVNEELTLLLCFVHRVIPVLI